MYGTRVRYSRYRYRYWYGVEGAEKTLDVIYPMCMPGMLMMMMMATH